MAIEICGVLLAAGSSTRFGSQKLLYDLPNKETILSLSAKTLKQSIQYTVAVVQDKNSEIAHILSSEGYKLIENSAYQNGIGSSISCAVKSTQPNAWVFALADMPFISKNTIDAVVQNLSLDHEIVAPYFQKIRGHPVGFNSSFREDLEKLNQDYGAKQLIQNNIDKLKGIETEDHGVITDIDTKLDLDFLINKHI